MNTIFRLSSLWLLCSVITLAQEQRADEPLRPDFAVEAVSLTGPIFPDAAFIRPGILDGVVITVETRSTEAWPHEAPLRVTLTDAAGGVAWEHEQIVRASGAISLHAIVPEGPYLLTAVLDPDDVIRERDESNNEQSEDVEVVVPPQQDLFFAEDTRVSRVEIVAEASSRPLHAFLTAIATSTVGADDALLSAQTRLPDANTEEADIILTLNLVQPDSNLLEALVDALEAQWVVDSAIVIESSQVLPARSLVLPHLAEIAITLSLLDQASVYWRVETQVRLEDWQSAFIADYLHPAVAISFLDANNQANGFTTYVRPEPWYAVSAVGYLPVQSQELEGTAIVDPFQTVDEFDEENNEIAFSSRPEPLGDLYFHEEAHVSRVLITADLENDATWDRAAHVVRASLGDQVGFVSAVAHHAQAGDTAGPPILVEIVTENFGTPVDIREAVKALEQEWYIDRVEVLPSILATTDTGIARTSEPIFEIQVHQLGVWPSAIEKAESNWRLETTVIYEYWGPLPLQFAPTPGTPIAVDYVDAAGSLARDYVQLPLGGRAISVAFIPATADGAVLTGVLDADQAIPEDDEQNNTIEIDTTPPLPREDLSLACDRARAQPIEVSASLRNPFLQPIVRRTGLATLGELREPLNLMVFPWRNELAAVDVLLGTDVAALDFDLVVVVPAVTIQARAFSSVAEALLDTYQDAWYVESASLLPVDRSWPVLTSVEFPFLDPITIGIKLAEHDQVVRYQHVRVPVHYEHDETPPERTLERWAPTVAVAFTGPDGQQVRDYVPLFTGRHHAIAFVPAEPESTIAIEVDPDDTVPEADEANNRCEIQGGPEPEPEAFFHLEAELVHAATDRETLVVCGKLVNPSASSITLEFSSGLQFDFTVGRSYRWSADKFFPRVLTSVTVAPGDTHEWIAHTSPAELIPGIPWVIEGELVGTEFRARTVVGDIRPPDPGPYPIPDLEEIQDLIVGPDGIFLPFLDHATLLNHGDSGQITETDGTARYQPEPEFGGEDFVLFRDVDGNQQMRRLRVGPQTVKIELSEGWTLVSFPVQPLEAFEALLARVPQGIAWVWRDGDYRLAREVRVGEGVWVHSSEAFQLEYLGEPVSEPGVDLVPGWNLLGTVNTDALPDDPRILSIHDHQGGNSQSPDRFESGRGYWLFATEAFRLPLN